MSNYNNPLDGFRTYSVHYTLALSDTSEAFRNLMSTGGSETYLNNLLSISTPGQSIEINNTKAFLLIDTRRFSQYSIDECIIKNASGGSANPQNPAEVTLGVSLQIKDTTGMTFYNTLIDVLATQLQVTSQSAFYLLNIFFVGHGDDGTSTLVSSTASILQALELEWNMSASGSTYSMQFLELESVAPQSATINLNYLGQVKSISTEGLTLNIPKDTIGAACSILEETINRQALSYFQRIKKDPKNDANENKLVQYVINIPDEWKNFKIDSAAKSKNEEALHISTSQKVSLNPNQKNLRGVGGLPIKHDPFPKIAGFNNANGGFVVSNYIQLSFSSSVAITDAVKIILESSTEFLKLLTNSEKDKTSSLMTYSISTNITSDNNSYLVYINVFPKKYTRILKQSTSEVAIGGSTNSSSTVVPNLIEYDYIFTGKNNNIKSLDLKFNNSSLMLIDTAVTIGKGALADKAAAQSSGKRSTENVNTKNSPLIFNTLRKKDYISVPIASDNQKMGFSNNFNEDQPTEEQQEKLTTKQQYRYIYATLNFQSNLQVNLVIRGNPNWIKKLIDRKERGGIPPHSLSINASDYAIENDDTFSNLNKEVNLARSRYYTDFYKPKLTSLDKVLSNTDDVLLNGIDQLLKPMFIKINIKSPNVDSAGNVIDGGLFTSDFFYKGTYQILQIDTTLNGDEFIHDILLIPNISDESQKDMQTP